jgi:hypothetical protein
MIGKLGIRHPRMLDRALQPVLASMHVFYRKDPVAEAARVHT